MKKLVKGLHHFQTQVFLSQKELFDRLSKGQSPDALFITCSDSRINPNLITQTEPGDLFILRNAGNIVPPYGASNGGEGATVELAVTGFGVRDIIVCGHSLCGAMNALLHPEKLENLPLLSSWLSNAESTKRITTENYKSVPKEDLQIIAVQENVLAQLENLRTHPSVAAKISRGELNLHAWVYKIETGTVFYYDPKEGQFEPLTQSSQVEDQKPGRFAFDRLI
ncbi:MAG: carbonic anhydrase [Candidatus Melainabacteria bacterium]|nr:carbonic anhydrase [Candidatus Melainabacteria bacterium]